MEDVKQAHHLSQTIPYCLTREEKRRRVRLLLESWKRILRGG